MPNSLAFLMLMIWPLVSVALFLRLSLERALIWTILGGYLFLPPLAALNLPVVPDLDKFSIPNLTAYLICTLMLGHSVPLWPTSRLARVMMVFFVLSPFFTVLTNDEPLIFGAIAVPGLRIYDSFAAVVNQFLVILPLFLARRFLVSAVALRELVVALVVGGMIYSFPMLIEVRLSPQINVWVYGFFQHDFGQMIRFGGFRPIVFLPHGLWAAFFALMTVLAALSMVRHEGPDRRPVYLAAALWLGAVLVLCKSVGPLVYGLVFAPMVLFLPVRLQLFVGAVLAAVVLVYPILRGGGFIPTGQILSFFSLIDEERAGSLAFRFGNEDELLAHAWLKPWFGWGGYGRNMIHDPFTGRIVSVADGAWVIAFGIYGWMGFLAQFGTLTLPLMLLFVEARRPGAVLPSHLGTVALILAANFVDLLPNATLVPFTWLLAGSILGVAEGLGRDRRAERQAALARPRSDSGRPRTVL